MHIFLTGEIQVGKSTLIDRVLAALGESDPGGFRTVSAVAPEDGRLSVYLVPAAPPDAPKRLENRVGIRDPGRGSPGFPPVFDRVGPLLLADAARHRLLLMDEIGRMEAGAAVFSARVAALLDGAVPILGVVRNVAHTPLAEAIRSHPAVELVTVTRDNRDTLVAVLAEKLRGQLAGGDKTTAG